MIPKQLEDWGRCEWSKLVGGRSRVHFEHIEMFLQQWVKDSRYRRSKMGYRVREINLSIDSFWRCLKPWAGAWGEIEIDKEIKTWAGGTPTEVGEKRQNHQETEEQPVRQENQDLTKEDKSFYLFFYSKIKLWRLHQWNVLFYICFSLSRCDVFPFMTLLFKQDLGLHSLGESGHRRNTKTDKRHL